MIETVTSLLRRIPLFRIFYSSTFTALFLLLICLLLLTPADALYQAYKSHAVNSFFIIAGVYVLTFLLAILIYSSRLYTNRSVLANIPKTYVPVEKGDVGKGVRKLVAQGLARSAAIAYEARPRDLIEEKERIGEEGNTTPPGSSHGRRKDVIKQPGRPTWGVIAHPGWSPPSSVDLPNLCYESVICELPNLIEAKAVSLAPADPLLTPRIGANGQPTPVPDARSVALLQRLPNVGLRDYIAHLTQLDLIRPKKPGLELLALYERARFSTRPLSETDFRTLMRIFADILRGMTHLDLDLVAKALQGQDHADETENEDKTSLRTLSDGVETPLPRSRSSSIYSLPSAAPSTRSGSRTTAYTAPLFQQQSSYGFPASSRYTSPRGTPKVPSLAATPRPIISDSTLPVEQGVPDRDAQRQVSMSSDTTGNAKGLVHSRQSLDSDVVSDSEIAVDDPRRSIDSDVSSGAASVVRNSGATAWRLDIPLTHFDSG